jgi:predicted RNA-binding Zn-ribbon protein involved in translation (DUF1610 family)
MAIFKKPILRPRSAKTREMPEGLWTKCPSCGEVIHHLALSENLHVCPKCGHHFTLGARERIESLVDPDSFQEIDASLTSVDSLQFKGVATYADRLKSYKEKTGLVDAITTGKIQDGKSIAGLLYYLEYRKNAPAVSVPVAEEAKPDIEAALKKEWEELHALPFPESPKDEALADLYADLVLEDGEIAGIVTSLLKGNKPDRKTVFINEELNEKLRAYQPAEESSKISRQQLIERKDTLDRLVKLALELYDR